MAIHVIEMRLTLQGDQVAQALANIANALAGGPMHAASRLTFQRADPIGDFLLLLSWCGYQAVYDECHHLVRFTGADEQLDVEQDPVLPALVGLVPAGSYVLYYDVQRGPRQVRYSESKQWIAQGTLHFPAHDRLSFPTDAGTKHFQREGGHESV